MSAVGPHWQHRSSAPTGCQSANPPILVSQGEFRGGVRSGCGAVLFRNGDTYEGMFKACLPQCFECPTPMLWMFPELEKGWESFQVIQNCMAGGGGNTIVQVYLKFAVNGSFLVHIFFAGSSCLHIGICHDNFSLIYFSVLTNV